MQDNACLKRFVAKLDWIETSDFESFTCPGGLTMTTVPLEHGRGYICQGFVFGTKDRVAYLSDVSAVPAETHALLMQKPIKLLVLDCLLVSAVREDETLTYHLPLTTYHLPPTTYYLIFTN